MQDISLTKHFKLQEFVTSRTAEKHGIANVPSEEAVENLRRLCEGCLEPLREAMGLPIVITSGYRCRALNVNHHFDVNLIFCKLRTKQFLKKSLEFNVA